MKQLLIGSVLSLAVAAPLSAQAHERECFDKGSLRYFECPALPVVLVDDVAADFSGFYAGATAGFAGAEVSGRFDSGGINDADIVNLDTTADGFAFGGYIGYMHQFENNIVLGVEIDGSIADLTAKADADPVAGDPEVVEADARDPQTGRRVVHVGFAVADDDVGVEGADRVHGVVQCRTPEERVAHLADGRPFAKPA